jgi:hypothetical protein
MYFRPERSGSFGITWDLKTGNAYIDQVASMGRDPTEQCPHHHDLLGLEREQIGQAAHRGFVEVETDSHPSASIHITFREG